MPNKLSRFWQELKRRNVTRVVTVYTGAAFVILSLVDMIREPFELPNWGFKLVVVILFVGLIIAVIISWIYDIHPEGGMVKTEPADKNKPEELTGSSKGWKIASYISFVVIVGLIVLNVIPRTVKKEILDKSIAVLPFDNDGPASENAAYLNGYCTAVHNNLCKIKDLRVLTLQSTEQYRNQPESIPEIAKNLGVGYVLTARGQIINNRVRLTVYLTDASDEIIWSNPYDRQIEVVDDHIDIQSEIAQLVADELQATITPEEMEIIENTPTIDLTAYDYYLQAEDELWDYMYSNQDQAALNRAKETFNKALDYDSTYAQAYVGLGKVYWQNHTFDEILTGKYLDSVLFYANKALSHDNKLASAYTLKGSYFTQQHMPEKALEELDKAVAFNPNNSEAYMEKGRLYWLFLNDNVLSLFNYHKAAELISGRDLPVLLRTLGANYISVGFKERGMQLNQQALELDGDSARYYHGLSESKWLDRDFEGIRDLLLQVVKLDTKPLYYLDLGLIYLYLGESKESLQYFQMILEEDEEQFSIFIQSLIGYAYWQIGNIEQANYHFDKTIETGTAIIRSGLKFEPFISWSLAAVFAIRGDRSIALESFKQCSANTLHRVLINQMITDPRFDSIHDEPEFQHIVRDLEAKYQAEHERVRQWLEENHML